MDLLSVASVRRKLDRIEHLYGVNSPDEAGGRPVNGIDRFFWLRASERENAEKPRFAFRSGLEAAEGDSTGDFRLCNLVLQGGGTLGLAHAGFVAGLERAGIRFLGLAGTSAGSIIAMGLAAIRGPDLARETHRKLADLSSSAPMDSFIDGPRPVRIFIKRALKRSGLFSPAFWFSVIAAVKRLRDRRGLNYGDVFETWFEEVMRELNFESIEQLDAALERIWEDISDLSTPAFGHDIPPPIAGNDTDDPDVRNNRHRDLLQLVTTAMPVGLKLTLPQDLSYLDPEYQRVSPARLVRTSMSIPAFFEPVMMRTNKTTWPDLAGETLGRLLPPNRLNYFKDLDELVFLDGGLVSNLPSDSFRQVMRDVPTIVVPLYGDQKNPSVTGRRAYSDLVSDALSCISAVRLQRDREVWQQNIELGREFERQEELRVSQHGGVARIYPTRMAEVNTADKDWLNFVMTEHDKTELFQTGLNAAEAFLKELKRQ